MGVHSIEKSQLSAKGMLAKVRSIFEQIPDPPRDPRGLKADISLPDCLMSAVAVFGLKFPSLLQFDESCDTDAIKHNLKTLYQVEKAPDDTNMRQRLDKVDPKFIRPAFTAIFSLLQRGKVLEDYKFLGEYLLIPCDGTGMFSSESVHCENCCEKHHKDGRVTYYHQMLGAVVVHPDQREVFPLCPEPISKSDGSTKNDCEQNAMKRLLEDFQREHPRLKVIFTEDALGAKGPCLKRIKEAGAHFIVNVNPTGNPSLFEWLKGLDLQKKTIVTKKETIELAFYNGVPLNDSNHDLQVNFIDCIVKNKKGKITGHFSWVTDILVTLDNVYQLSRGGRARWKIENETFNTLKNQSYQFEHNFGHGYRHLSHVFGLLMFLAFLIDQVQQRCCGLFRAALAKMKRKIRFWDRLRCVFLEYYIDSWADIFMWITGKGMRRLSELLNTS
ncbi:MAG TPA: transposase [Rhabdochlamydiaceae bacterium]|nr:transposase [Rhabdochlamydiaceae bacterium]